jgi:hypothetical protein
MVTNAAPQRVVLSPESRAYARINKYRCDHADKRIARRAALIPPDAYRSFRLRLGRKHHLAYCGRGDPGSVVHVSPVVSSRSQLSAHL